MEKYQMKSFFLQFVFLSSFKLGQFQYYYSCFILCYHLHFLMYQILVNQFYMLWLNSQIGSLRFKFFSFFSICIRKNQTCSSFLSRFFQYWKNLRDLKSIIRFAIHEKQLLETLKNRQCHIQCQIYQNSALRQYFHDLVLHI